MSKDPTRRVRTSVGLPDRLEPLEVEIPASEPDPWGPESRFAVVGRPTPRLDAVEKVMGRAVYTADVVRPGMLHAAVLGCPHPKARVVRVDAERARAADGVRAVTTAEGRTLHFAGEPVAAIAAESRAQAEAALDLLSVEYEVRPWVVDLEEARTEAVSVYDDSANVKEPTVRTKGDVDRALADAAVVVKATYTTRVQTHCCLETHGAVAEWEGDHLTVWISTQGTFSVKEGLMDALDLSADQVSVICEYMGGGFGSKFGPGSYGVTAAELARLAGAPVKLMTTRKHEHLGTGNRPSSVMRLEVGADEDGTIRALALDSYGSPGIGTGAGVSGPIRNTLEIESYRTVERDVLTNTGPGAPMRAPGHPQGAFALAQIVDELAARLGRDPLELFKQNDRHPVRCAQYDVGAAAIGWDRREVMDRDNQTQYVKRGLGMAPSVWYNTGGPGATVEISLQPDGRIRVRNGAQDIGTGTRTFVGMIAAEELGVPLAELVVDIGNTDFPRGPGSGGSSTTPTLSPAVRSAAHRFKGALQEAAARELGSPTVSLESGLTAVSPDGKKLALAELARRLPESGLTVQGSRVADHAGGPDLIAGVQFAEVEVDVGTGRIRVLRIVAVHDCGRVINPLLVESQINGGIIGGLSFALHEERILDPATGLMLNANLEQYKIAGAIDVPEIEVIPFHLEVGFTNTGALGIGEAPIIPTAGAIANGVAHATGVRVRDLPMTPDRVLAALDGGAADA